MGNEKTRGSDVTMCIGGLDSVIQKLKREDLIDDIVVIKVNKSYKSNMSALELYEVTRGIWKRKIESVSKGRYCLSVANSNVIEVYEIEQWYPAGTIPMQTRALDSANYDGRIEFVGHVADDDIRARYIGKSVADLYKPGEADPVKLFLKDVKINKTLGINDEIEPIMVIKTEDAPLIICPTCENSFEKAPRCPECGQLIKYVSNVTKKIKFKSLDEWAVGASIIGAKGEDVIAVINKMLGQHSGLSYHLGTKDLSIDFIGKTGEKLQVLMLFGKERCGAIQPSTYVSYFEKNGIQKAILDEYLEKMKAVLSSDQKNQPYERMNGYYFIDYKTITEKPDELINIIIEFCNRISK